MAVVYDEEGLRAEIVDGEAVAIYVEGQLKLELTIAEFHAVAFALMHKPVAGLGD